VIDDTLLDAEERMDKALSVAREDLGSVRTGRAAPSMFNKIAVDYYGAYTPVPQMASISVPEARMAVIKPYDMSQLRNRGVRAVVIHRDLVEHGRGGAAGTDRAEVLAGDRQGLVHPLLGVEQGVVDHFGLSS
jgi:hypothetical protein